MGEETNHSISLDVVILVIIVALAGEAGRGRVSDNILAARYGEWTGVLSYRLGIAAEQVIVDGCIRGSVSERDGLRPSIGAGID